MKKSILIIALLLASCATYSPIKALDMNSIMNSLKGYASKAYDKGKKFLSDNSDTIFDKVKENAGPLFDKAKELLFGKAKEEATKEETEIKTEAKKLVETHKSQLTPAQQQEILKEANNLATKNKEALIQQSNQLISQKREELMKNVRAKYAL